MCRCRRRRWMCLRDGLPRWRRAWTEGCLLPLRRPRAPLRGSAPLPPLLSSPSGGGIVPPPPPPPGEALSLQQPASHAPRHRRPPPLPRIPPGLPPRRSAGPCPRGARAQATVSAVALCGTLYYGSWRLPQSSQDCLGASGATASVARRCARMRCGKSQRRAARMCPKARLMLWVRPQRRKSRPITCSGWLSGRQRVPAVRIGGWKCMLGNASFGDHG